MSWLVASLSGCAAAPPGPGATGPAAPEPAVAEAVASPLQEYRRLGLIAGPERFPAVASLSTLAGRGDSTFLLLGLSIPPAALQFQRSGDGFAADYRVALRVTRDSLQVSAGDWRETVRVASFAETSRTEGVVLFQAALCLEPGTYRLALRVRDGLSARGFETADTVVIPTLPGDGALAAPILAYRALPRSRRGSDPALVLDPRRTAAYGGDSLLVYLERYGETTAGTPVRLEARAETGATVWTRPVELPAGDGLAAAAVPLPVDSLPLGRFRLRAVADHDSSGGVPFRVTVSDRWLVGNLDEALDLLRHIAPAAELEPLGRGTAEERRKGWEAFWAARDPVPATAVNEFRETFFQRVRVAAERFGEGDRPGWRTDRGEVYIVLGPPTRSVELPGGPDRRMGRTPDAREWLYDRVPGVGRLSLVFVDRQGSGEYRLTDASAAAFRDVSLRLMAGTSSR